MNISTIFDINAYKCIRLIRFKVYVFHLRKLWEKNRKNKIKIKLFFNRRPPEAAAGGEKFKLMFHFSSCDSEPILQ
jgi:hypothetical protein